MPQHTQTVGYVRVSSDDQNLARQLEAIGDVDRIFSDKVSGGSRENREALSDCITYVRHGDVVKVASMDRLARSLRDMRDIVDEIIAKGRPDDIIANPSSLTGRYLSGELSVPIPAKRRKRSAWVRRLWTRTALRTNGSPRSPDSPQCLSSPTRDRRGNTPACSPSADIRNPGASRTAPSA